MFSFTDQTGRTVSLTSTPQRIISLVPSQTELLFDLGLDEEVVGITKFCIHPAEWFYSKARVGGTKKINLSAIHQLEPDLIIANKEENVKEQVEELANSYPVWVSDVNDLEDAYQMIEQVGLMTNTNDKAQSLITLIKSNFAQLPKKNTKPRTAYLIWNDPYMTIGGDTFINSMLDLAGYENIFANKTRYPEVRVDDLQKENLEFLLLSSEPFPFKQKHIDQLQPHLPGTKILLVDGEMFSWYGSRLQYAPRYFLELQRLMIES